MSQWCSHYDYVLRVHHNNSMLLILGINNFPDMLTFFHKDQRLNHNKHVLMFIGKTILLQNQLLRDHFVFEMKFSLHISDDNIKHKYANI